MIKIRSTLATLAAVALAANLGVAVIAADETEPAGSMPPIGVFSIEDMTWLLTSQVVDGEMTPLSEGVVVSLTMEGGKAGGSGGCNNYFTSYQINGFEVSFNEIGSTLRGCPGPVSDVESAYFTNLGHVAAYQSGGIQMALKDANDDFLLEFDLSPPSSIVGSWTAQGINTGNQAVVSSATTPLVTALFSDDGQLTGNDGCNDYFTTYQIDADSITISAEIGSTKMACTDEALAAQSQQYYAALTSATTWSVDVQGLLELRDDEGSLQVRYLPADA